MTTETHPALRLEPITPDNVRAACRVEVAPGQEKFVAPVMFSLAEAYANIDTAWPRLVYDGDRPVGFVMVGFDDNPPHEAYRCGIWRLNIAADVQGKGYGSFAVRAVLDEARRRGERRVTVSWVEGEGGPAEFYQKLGFRVTGEILDDEIVAEIFVDGTEPAPTADTAADSAGPSEA
ncbi:MULTISPECIES: GNAT family N-acetyltransferase [Streptomyces]|uniref:GNAT family N-acetyltransferase n=1 Tax=Streptomyces TaxID=1883 RepID=UPI000CD5458F|nr:MULTISPECIES: GNAT family N-acetyltransferase [Streptomyces]